MQQYVKFYYDFPEVTETLGDSELKRLVFGMIKYAETGIVPELKGAERHLFPMFKAQIDRDKERYQKVVENGKKGGRPSNTTSHGENQTEPKETNENQTEPKETKNKEKRIKNKEKRIKNEEYVSTAREEFERFWAAYPRKIAKKDAYKAFCKVSVPVDALIKAVERQKTSSQWRRDDGQFIPHPATWLNQARWEDEVEPQKGVIAQPPSDDIKKSSEQMRRYLQQLKEEA